MHTHILFLVIILVCTVTLFRLRGNHLWQPMLVEPMISFVIDLPKDKFVIGFPIGRPEYVQFIKPYTSNIYNVVLEERITVDQQAYVSDAYTARDATEIIVPLPTFNTLFFIRKGYSPMKRTDIRKIAYMSPETLSVAKMIMKDVPNVTFAQGPTDITDYQKVDRALDEHDVMVVFGHLETLTRGTLGQINFINFIDLEDVPNSSVPKMMRKQNLDMKQYFPYYISRFPVVSCYIADHVLMSNKYDRRFDKVYEMITENLGGKRNHWYPTINQYTRYFTLVPPVSEKVKQYNEYITNRDALSILQQ